MVTSEVKSAQRFTLEIRQGNNGAILATIHNERGKYQTYEIDSRKLRIFASLNPVTRDVLDFLLGGT
jgi:hypothetical protein